MTRRIRFLLAVIAVPAMALTVGGCSDGYDPAPGNYGANDGAQVLAQGTGAPAAGTVPVAPPPAAAGGGGAAPPPVLGGGGFPYPKANQ